MSQNNDFLNRGIEFDKSLIENVRVNQPAIESYIKSLLERRTLKNPHQIAWLLRAVTCIDLTTLAGNDTASNVERLCEKATRPINKQLLAKMGMQNEGITVAAVCVYPAQVANCKRKFISLGCRIPIAAVATGFPTGQYHLKTRLEEIKLAVADGASEIDIVINRDLALCGEWEEVYKEVKQMKKACGEGVLMKAILATGELEDLYNVYKASMVCMMAGADFIKTSTGKETVNATLIVGTVMARAIQDYYDVTGYKVGLKPAGGIRTSKSALQWLILMKEELGNEWLMPNLFRIGASGLLGNIEKEIFNYITGYVASEDNFPFL